MIILRESAYPAVPWKNGGGITREIHRVPSDAAAFDWRLSLATIDVPGPFSAFDGYDRTLVLVGGAGVVLEFGRHGGITLAAPGQLAAFDGAWETTCTLLDGQSRDLNLMVSRERTEAHVRVIAVTTAEVIQTADWDETLVCCISGAVRMENASRDKESLNAVDVARCFAADGNVTCSTQSAAPALLFVAVVRRRS